MIDYNISVIQKSGDEYLYKVLNINYLYILNLIFIELVLKRIFDTLSKLDISL